MKNLEITKRELLFSVIIVCVMLTIGFFIGTSIDNSVKESNELYYKALKIDNDSTHFNYGMKTNIGNALVYGEFTTVDPVSISELTGEYSSILIETERYTKKTRTITEKDSKGNTKTRTETYYEWDTIDKTYNDSKEISFLGNTYSTSKFNLDNRTRLSLDRETVNPNFTDRVSWNYIYSGSTLFHSVGDLRYSYFVIPTRFSGSILVSLKNENIYNIHSENNKIGIHHNQTIPQIIEHKQKSEDTPVLVFWVVWIIVTGGCVFGFMYLDNRWLKH